MGCDSPLVIVGKSVKIARPEAIGPWRRRKRRMRKEEGRGRGNQTQAKLCEAQALREQGVCGQVVQGQKLGPFLGRGGGMALKPSKLCEAQALREQVVRGEVVRGPVVRGLKLGPFLGRGGGMARDVGVACKEKDISKWAWNVKEMSKWPEILWDG